MVKGPQNWSLHGGEYEKSPTVRNWALSYLQRHHHYANWPTTAPSYCYYTKCRLLFSFLSPAKWMAVVCLMTIQSVKSALLLWHSQKGWQLSVSTGTRPRERFGTRGLATCKAELYKTTISTFCYLFAPLYNPLFLKSSNISSVENYIYIYIHILKNR
jgi:hypothetical protein